MLKNIRLIITFTLLALMPLTACASDHDVRMMNTDGKAYALNDYIGQGKWVVVNVWATRCPFCRHELFDLGNFHEDHYLKAGAKKDAMVLGLTINLPDFTMPDKDYVAQFKEDYLIDFPLLLVDQALAQQVIGKPINMVPVSFFYNPEGKLVYQLKGMATEAVLNAIISRKSSDYKQAWAKEMPPEYRPSKSQ
jgi:thiol-disulfide isomerase/thioredoxin